MITLHPTIQKHVNDTRDSPTVDQQLNNAFAHYSIALSLSAHYITFKYCLRVLGCAEMFTSARWTLLQVCPHVLFDSLFNVLFRKLRRLVDHRERYLSDYVSDVFEDVKRRLVGRGCLPKGCPNLSVCTLKTHLGVRRVVAVYTHLNNKLWCVVYHGMSMF